MLSESFSYTFPLSKPFNVGASRITKKLSSLNQSRYIVVCAAVQSRQNANMATLYDLLELSPDVSISDIKQAYRQMARKYHPDVCPSHQAEESTRRFIEIQEAYETLSDPRRKALYDHAVAMGRSSAATGRMPWMTDDKEAQASDWKSRWENQLHELQRRSAMKARKADSWSARVRREQGLSDT